jgi:heme-degrading monooxygenase HmoA
MVATIWKRKEAAMHTRVVTFTGVKDFEGGIALVRDEVLPVLNEQKGYRGTTVSADQSGGVLGVLSLWDTAADREASFGALAKARQRGVEITGAEMTIESFEELVSEINEVPAVGSALMVTRISMEPAKIGANLEFFKSEVLPRIKANDGFQALRNMINRETGEGIVGSVWRDQEAMKAAAAGALARREEATARGVAFGGDSYRELVLVELR